jgi:hypothetical protein
MFKKFTYYGSGKSRNYFLDLYPSAYYYSLNRGSIMSTDVCRAVADSITADLTPEDINQSSLSAIFTGSNFVRIDRLYNQGSVSREFVQNTQGERPFLADSARLPYIDNGMNYIFFAGGVNTRMTTATASSLLDNDCTVYMVYRSQNSISIQGVFVEQETVSNRITMFSDTQATGFVLANYRPDAVARQLNYTTQQPIETIRVVAYRKTGNLVEGFDENGFIDSQTTSATFSANTFFEIGRREAGPIWFGGRLGNLIIRTTSDSNTTMTDIMDFLKLEYGI